MSKYKLIGEKEGKPTIVEVMSKVKKDQGGITQIDYELFHKALASRGIYHVPKHIYQVMYDIAQSSYTDVEYKKEKTRNFLLSWIKDTFPGKQLDNFVDLSIAEAQALHPSLRWGMYVKVSSEGLGIEGDITKEMKLLCNTVQNTKQLGH